MVGSVIPGIRIRVHTKVVNYPDGTMHPLIKRRRYVNPLVSVPDMHGEHGASHPMLKKLQQLLSGPGQQHPHAKMGMIPTAGPKMLEGYAPVHENLQWRRS